MSARRLAWLMVVLAAAGCSSRGYQREGGRWAWVWYDGEGRQVRPLPDAGAELTVLADPNYATSAGNVYLWGVRLPGAAPGSFDVSAYPYSRDGARVFCGSVPVAGADPRAFRVLGGLLEPQYLSRADAWGVVFGPITTVPGDAEIVVTQGWGRDDKACYFGPTPVAGADPASFAVLNDWFARDAKRAYCGHRTIPGADVATFRVTGPLAAADKDRKYSKWQFDKQ